MDYSKLDLHFVPVELVLKMRNLRMIFYPSVVLSSWEVLGVVLLKLLKILIFFRLHYM